jgi:hypothetical protein
LCIVVACLIAVEAARAERWDVTDPSLFSVDAGRLGALVNEVLGRAFGTEAAALVFGEGRAFAESRGLGSGATFGAAGASCGAGGGAVVVGAGAAGTGAGGGAVVVGAAGAGTGAAGAEGVATEGTSGEPETGADGTETEGTPSGGASAPTPELVHTLSASAPTSSTSDANDQRFTSSPLCSNALQLTPQRMFPG